MNAYQIVFKSGTSVVVYQQAKDPEYDEDVLHTLNNENVDCIIDITANTKNEAAWIIEHKEKLEQLSINRDKVTAAAECRAVDKQVDLEVRKQNRFRNSQSSLTQARLTAP